MRTMYDAVTAANIPRSAAMVAGYIDRIKLAPWTAADWARFPSAVKVEIVKKASTNAGHVLDVEIGDATPAEAPGWVRMRRAAGADPTVYCNTSTWPAVRAAFQAAHVAEPHYWVAVYDGDPKWRDGWAAAGVVAKQYGGNVPGGYDLSSVADHWPGVDPAPTQEDDMPYTPEQLKDIGKQSIYEARTDPGNRNVLDFVKEIFAASQRLEAQNAGILAALAAATKDPAITLDAMRQVVDEAVAQHVQITGEVHIGPATT